MINGGDHYLDVKQLARIEALEAARKVLVAIKSPFGGTTAPDAMDLYYLASYVITGEDPWGGAVVETPEQRSNVGPNRVLPLAEESTP